MKPKLAAATSSRTVLLHTHTARVPMTLPRVVFMGVNNFKVPLAACSHLLTLAGSSTLKMEAIRPSKTSVHTRSTRRHIPEDGILHSHHCENLKSYKKNLILDFPLPHPN
jgi:hypothetical protein